MMSRTAGKTPWRTEVAIVGAGLAGLAAAYTLAAAGVDVLVLEARDRVGGRTHTTLWHDGTPIDLGGQWVGPGQDRIVALASAVGVGTFPTYDDGKYLLYLRSEAAPEGERIEYASTFPRHDPALATCLTATLGALDAMAQEVPLDAPWTAPRAAEWDGQTFETWIAANVPVPGARAWLRVVSAAIFAAEPHDLSLLHVLFYSRSSGGWYPLVETTGGAQERRFHGGAQQISIRVAQELGERVLLNAPVYAIEQDAHGVRVRGEGVEMTARQVIVALPPALAGRLRYRPALPALRDQLTQRVPMGSVIKVHCLYETPFWRANGLSGQITSDTGPVGTTYDNSPPDGTLGVLAAFVEGDHARRFARLSAEERRAAVLADLRRYLGPQAANPIGYAEQSWAQEEYTRGCYAGYMPPGVWTGYGPELRAPVGRIYWAGTETATVGNGYMDGAVRSGERAAGEVIAALGILAQRESMLVPV